jgi:hypothetical protein
MRYCKTIAAAPLSKTVVKRASSRKSDRQGISFHHTGSHTGKLDHDRLYGNGSSTTTFGNGAKLGNPSIDHRPSYGKILLPWSNGNGSILSSREVFANARSIPITRRHVGPYPSGRLFCLNAFDEKKLKHP